MTPRRVSKEDLARRMEVVHAAATGILSGLPCADCGRPTVNVRFTHPAPAQCRTWSVCGACGFEMRTQNSGRPVHFRESLVDRELEARDRR